MEVTVSPAAIVTFLTNPAACSGLACTCPVTTLPIGHHSLEGRSVAMERGRLVSKTRQARRDLKKTVLGAFSLIPVSSCLLYTSDAADEDSPV